MKNVSPIRVRFAPSPTGNLHIGSLRSALFNWLFARHNNGIFLLRIEDTDAERSKKVFLDSILSAFSWIGITSDEPMVTQSERIVEYQAVAHNLISRVRLIVVIVQLKNIRMDFLMESIILDITECVVPMKVLY